MPEPTPDERRDDTERRGETARLDGAAETTAFDRVLADDAATAQLGWTATTPPPPPAATPVPTAADGTVPGAPLPRPTIRWGALVWALLFGTIAAFTLWTLVDLQHRDEVLFWIAAVPLPLVPLYLLAVVGVVVALFGIVGLIRRGERQRRGTPSAPAAPSHHGGAPHAKNV